MKLVQKQNFEPKIKPMIVNLQNKLYQLKNKQEKGAKLCANIRSELEGGKAPKRSSEYVKDKICKCKKYLKYILMIKKQNILWTFLNLQKKKTAATTEFFTKNPNIKKISNEQFNPCETEIS